MKSSCLSRIETLRRQYGSRASILLQDGRRTERAFNYSLESHTLRWELPVFGSVFFSGDAEADIGKRLCICLTICRIPFNTFTVV